MLLWLDFCQQKDQTSYLLLFDTLYKIQHKKTNKQNITNESSLETNVLMYIEYYEQEMNDVKDFFHPYEVSDPPFK